MPCQDTWSESERDGEEKREKRELRVKKLTGYVARELGYIHTPLHDHQANTRFLCSSIKKMSQHQLDKIVYNTVHDTAGNAYYIDWTEPSEE